MTHISPEQFLKQHGITDHMQIVSLSVILREFNRVKNSDLIRDLDTAVRIIQTRVSSLTKEEQQEFSKICTSYFPNGQYCGGP